MTFLKSVAFAGQGVVGKIIDQTTNETKTPYHKSLLQFPDMPEDKVFNAKAAKSSKEPSITDIGMHRVATKK